MQLFTTQDTIAALEASLADASAKPEPASLTTLAWHLRQRDSRRALELTVQAEQLLTHSVLPASERQRLSARLLLVRGEGELLHMHLDSALDMAGRAAQAFSSLNDPLGCGDAFWLESSVHLDRGDIEQLNAGLARTEQSYRRAADEERTQAATARRLIYAAFVDPAQTAAELALAFPLDRQIGAGVATWVESVRANVAGLTDDPGSAIRHDLAAYRFALEIGEIRQALVAVTNATEGFATLGDLESAMDWIAQALALARPTGWPASIGMVLTDMGSILRQLGRLDEAADCLKEAAVLMAPLTASRTYGQMLGTRGQVAVDKGEFEQGLAWFNAFERSVLPHHEPDLMIKAWHGQATVLCSLGLPIQARAKALEALALARAHANLAAQISMLTVLAHIHLEHPLPCPEQGADATPALHYLNQALAVAAHISNYAITPELYSLLAGAYAAHGDFAAAYQHSQAAHAAHTRSRTQEAQRRALALQIRQEVDLAHAETEQHRQLAETLRQTTATLETLGTIGREITARLDAQAVFEALHRHVNDLLDATFFGVYLTDADQTTLSNAFSMENGVRLPARTLALDNPVSRIALCARERREIVVDALAEAEQDVLIPGTQATSSLMYAPLMVGPRLLGVMSIQSIRPHAYGEREQSIFRTLCAYGAIALDNAGAYATAAAARQQAAQALQELRSTQALLVEQNRQLERLAVTDQLTGLFNRLHLDRALEDQRQRNQRFGTPLCVLLIDLDHFKSVNDTFGHAAGDAVLQGVARVLHDCTRKVDVPGRWGGEEFLVLCTETELGGAMVLAEKLRLAIGALAIDPVKHCSASFGVAAYHPGELGSETIARADNALYHAKKNGRNRVECGEPTTPELP